MKEFQIKIVNEKGLHARASAKFVETVESFDSRCEITKDGITVSGDSIMGLLMLAASKGSFITVKVWGNESDLLMTSLKSLINRNFEEDS
tara:strand:- start:554 stop:823 length:270 start_codon:yes stop_codon:yes gene_type:complete